MGSNMENPDKSTHSPLAKSPARLEPTLAHAREREREKLKTLIGKGNTSANCLLAPLKWSFRKAYRRKCERSRETEREREKQQNKTAMFPRQNHLVEGSIDHLCI